MDDNRTRGTRGFLSGEKVFNVEGDQSVVPGEGAIGFLLPLGSHDGTSRMAAAMRVAAAAMEGGGWLKVGGGRERTGG